MNYEVCPGEGRCHGSLAWCDWCGDVSNVCDAARCDRHRCQECNEIRPPEEREHWAYVCDVCDPPPEIARLLAYREAARTLANNLAVAGFGALMRRVVFVMLNPSTADAFVLDPTVRRCVGFAQRFGADYLEVVNLFALRSTDPGELYKRAPGARGDDQTNNEQIIAACRGATKVIAGWGVHGELGDRGEFVRRMLRDEGIALHHLGLSKAGHPRHPLYLKASAEIGAWT